MGLTITNLSSDPIRHLEWGLEGPGTYNPATPPMLDSDNLVTSGFTGVNQPWSGAYDPNATGNAAIAGGALTAPTALAGTGNQSHIGSFRVKARVWVDQPDCSFRLAWQAGDGPRSRNQWAKPLGALQWYEIDLGTITISAAVRGTQSWNGRVETVTKTAATAALDYLILIPVTAGYGKARTAFSYQPGVMAGSDDFTGTTAGGALNGRVAPAGGTWATSGVATDFTFSDDLDNESIKRATADAAFDPRLALLGSTTYGDVDTSMRFYVPAAAATLAHGLRARYVDSSNYLNAVVSTGSFTDRDILQVSVTVAGVSATFTTAEISPLAPGWYRLRLLAWQTGYAVAALYSYGDVGLTQVGLPHASLKAGGALATGKVGITDAGNATVARYYDEFYVGAPAPEPIVCHPGQSLEVTSADVLREDVTGTVWGRPPSYLGSRFTVPVGTSRVFVKARKNDVETGPDDGTFLNVQVQASWVARGLVVPRA